MIFVIIGSFVFLILLGLLNKYLTIKLYSKVSADLKLGYFVEMLKIDVLALKSMKVVDIHYRMFTDVNTVCSYILDIILAIPIKILYIHNYTQKRRIEILYENDFIKN